MLPDRVSNPGPLTYKSGALPIALRGPSVKARVAILVWDIQHDLFYIAKKYHHNIPNGF